MGLLYSRNFGGLANLSNISYSGRTVTLLFSHLHTLLSLHWTVSSLHSALETLCQDSSTLERWYYHFKESHKLRLQLLRTILWYLYIVSLGVQKQRSHSTSGDSCRRKVRPNLTRKL